MSSVVSMMEVVPNLVQDDATGVTECLQTEVCPARHVVLRALGQVGPEVLPVGPMKIPSRCRRMYLNPAPTGGQVLVLQGSSVHQGSVRHLVLAEEPMEPEVVGEQPVEEHLAKSVKRQMLVTYRSLEEVRQLACDQPLVPLLV